MWDAVCNHIQEYWIQTRMGREGLLTLLREPNLAEEKKILERVSLFLLSLPDSKNYQGIKIPKTQRESHVKAEHWDSHLPLSVAQLCCCFIVQSWGAQVHSRAGQRDTESLSDQSARRTQTALSRAESRRNALLQWSLGSHNCLRRWKHKS